MAKTAKQLDTEIQTIEDAHKADTQYQLFRGQDLEGHDFSGQDLTGSNFRECKLKGADFTDAILEYANFKDADLTGIKTNAGTKINGCPWLSTLMAKATYAKCDKVEPQWRKDIAKLREQEMETKSKIRG